MHREERAADQPMTGAPTMRRSSYASSAPSSIPAIFRDQTRLEAERRRLIAYCSRQVNGDRTAADEIAQEALTLAWRERDKLRVSEAWQPWLTGIARNLCLRRRKSGAIEARRSATWSDTAGMSMELIPDLAAPDPLAELEQGERAELLDRALAMLPRAAHALLIERYVDDLPLAEIALRHGMREETAAVQLFRGRAALKKLLTTTDLRAEAVSLGVVSPSDAEAGDWTETRLWCPKCGDRRLLGRFGPFPSKSEESSERRLFALRCPSCSTSNEISQALMVHSWDVDAPAGSILRDVKGYRAGFKRMTGYFHRYAETAVATGTVSCYHCGAPASVARQRSADALCSTEEPDTEPIFYSKCDSCRRHICLSLTERGFMLPESQKFWSENPRSRLLPSLEIATADGAAFMTRLESVTSREAMEIVTDAATLAVRSILRV